MKILSFILNTLLFSSTWAAEVLDAPFTSQTSSRERAAIKAVFCDANEIGTGVHIGAGLIVWAMHARQTCSGGGQLAGFGWSDMKLLYCNGASDFCVSQITDFNPNSSFAKNYFAISLSSPKVNQQLRSVGLPSGEWSMRASQGPVLKYVSSMNVDQYRFQWYWYVAVSNLPGNSNSPAFDDQGNISIFMNSANRDDYKYSVAQLRNNPTLASGGIQASDVAKKMWSSSLNRFLCRDANSVYGCRR